MSVARRTPGLVGIVAPLALALACQPHMDGPTLELDHHWTVIGDLGAAYGDGAIVHAVSADGLHVEAIPEADGTFSMPLAGGVHWSLAVSLDHAVALYFQAGYHDASLTSSFMTPPLQLVSTSPFSRRTQSDGYVLDLGPVLAGDGLAVVDPSPLAALDCDGDGIVDLEDDDADGNGIDDRHQSPPSIDLSAVGMLVAGIAPAILARDVAPDEPIVIDLSREPALGEHSEDRVALVDEAGSAVAADLATHGRGIIVTPTAALEPGARYTVVLSPDVADVDGTRLGTTFRAEFTVAHGE